MIAFTEMLVPIAKKCNIEIPSDIENYSPEDFPHFYVFSVFQIGRPIEDNWTSHWNNAEIIGNLSKEEAKSITFEELFKKGCK